MNNQQLRKQLQRERQQLPADYIAAAEVSACRRLTELSEFKHAKRIAAFFGSKGELNPIPALIHAHAQGKECYLPVLHPFFQGRLWFARWHPTQKLQCNRFGIPEPIVRARKLIKPSNLDLVVTPLVAFNTAGKRMGMGGGFYDRTFAFLIQRTFWHKPSLIGFAFDLQKSEQLSNKPWDVPLNMVVTEHHIYRPTPNNLI